MRLLIGVPSPLEVKSSLNTLQQAFQESPPGIRWVSPNQMHITVKFFGEITQQEQQRMTPHLKRLVQGQDSFSASIEAVGGFPSLDLPRVLWVGLGQGASPVTVLAQAVEEESRSLGFKPEERVFHPHVTLARIESPQVSRSIGESAKSVQWAAPAAWQVTRLMLYRSTLSADGPRYEVLEEFPLSK